MKSNIFITAAFLILLVSCGNRQSYQTIETSYEDDYVDDWPTGEEGMESFEDDIRFEDETRSYGKDNTHVYKENEPINLQGYNQTIRKDRDKGFLSDDFQGNSTKIHELRDARTGIVVCSAEYPSDWEVISKPTYTLDQKLPTFLIQIQGPNNLKTFNTPIKFHIAYQSEFMAQVMRQSEMANMIRQEVSARQLISEEVVDRMQKSGFTFVGEKQIPEVKKHVRKIVDENGGANTQIELIWTIWENKKGQKAMASITKFSLIQPVVLEHTMKSWFYSTDYVFVDEHAFDDTVANTVKAALSIKYNPEWKRYTDHLMQQRSAKAQREATMAHQSRMAQREASFNAHQQKMKGIWAAQDANHASFMGRNFGAGSDTSQRNFVNMINEQETVYNPLNGKNYQVQAGSMQYWMDSDGKYINNNNLFYTPNGDINLNNREWVKVRGEY